MLQKIARRAAERGHDLEGYITALLAKKREMEEALREFIASRAQRGCRRVVRRQREPAQMRVDNAGSAFDRVMARQTGVSGLGPTSPRTPTQLKELQDLAAHAPHRGTARAS